MMSEAPAYRPLYRQVYDIIVKKVAEGAWRPGEALPSEQALARELGVSQGTVRKVLDALTAENLMERRQGKGTFLAENTQDRTLFRFFKMARPGGDRVIPESEGETVRVRASRVAEQAKLDLSKGDKVVEILRTRRIDGKPAIRETIILSAAMFPDFEKHAPLPNTLYSLYQTAYGLNIVMAKEELRPDLAAAEDERILGVPVGSPLLCVDRLALSLQDMKVEWRVSRIATAGLVYAVSLS
ncbi:MAG: GntR family transcriptional regulator [Aliidongia sp.]